MTKFHQNVTNLYKLTVDIITILILKFVGYSLYSLAKFKKH